MPTYRITAPDGRKLRITGDMPPTELELEEIFGATKAQDQQGAATAALGLPNAAPALDMGKRFLGGVGRALNPMNLIQAGADIAGSQFDALSQGDMTGLIPFAPMGRRMAQASADRLGEATRLAVDEGDLLGAAGQLGAAVPVAGEMAAGMGQRAADTGDYAGMAGELTGAAFGPKLAGGIARRVIAPVTRVGGKVLTAAPRVGKNAFSTWLDGDAGPLKSIAREVRKEVKGAIQGPKPKRVVDDSVKEARQIAKVDDKAMRAELDRIRKMDKMDREAAASNPAPEPAPTAPNQPAKPSSVPQTARDVDSALKSLDKASQARLKHVVKKAMSERPAPSSVAPVRDPFKPDPSSVAPGRDPFKLGDRVYTVDKAVPSVKRSKIAEHYDISPDPALAPEGATGVHPTLGLPMRADGKVLVRNVEEFSDVPGRPPRGNPVWRDPDARFGNNQTINEVAEMLEARGKTPSSISDVQKRLADALKKEGADIKPTVSAQPASKTVKDIESALEAKGLKVDLSEKNGVVTLSRIVVPKELRNQGIGSKAMEEILDHADSKGLRVALSPTSDFGGSKARLVGFYNRFGFKPNTGKTADMSISESMIRNPVAKASTYADDAAASAARQKQHISDNYAAKEVKDAANVKRSESLIPDLEQSTELLKKYPKRGGETNSQWMQRVTKKINEEKSSPSAAQEIANDLAGRIQELSVKEGLSRAQIKAVLEQNHGIPSKYSSQMVNMVLGKKGK